LVLCHSVYDEALGLAEGFEPIEEGQRRTVAVLAAQKGPGLARNKIGGEDLLRASESA
jgi:hypothetical protein